MIQNCLVGCSGYYYPAWKNKFYPPGTPSSIWLEYYSSVFNSVELNGTFYRQPKVADLQKYYRVTSPGFKFSVKVSRYLTHVLKLKDIAAQVNSFQDLILGGLQDKLAFFLFQMPPTFLYNEEHLAGILASVPPNAHNVIEFRHISWWNEQVFQAFRQAGLTFCNVDFPGINSFFTMTSGVFYLRLHGNPVLFKSSYTDALIREYSELIPKDSKEVAVYFNNTYFEAGYQNAFVMKSILNS